MASRRKRAMLHNMLINPLFAEGLHVALLRRMRLIRSEDRAEARRRVVLGVSLAWLPLAILAALAWLGLGNPDAAGFFSDITAQARYLLAVPLLIVADYIVLPRLKALAGCFGGSTLLPPSRQDAFLELMASSRRLSAGPWPSTIVALLAYATVISLAAAVPPAQWAAWQSNPVTHARSLPGWWHLLVSMPMLLGLTLSWVWRWMLWVRVMWRLSRMGPVLVASHPDHAGGLGFLAESARAFTPVVLPLAVIVAATMAHNLVLTGQTAVGHEATPVITAVLAVVITASPPFLFMRVLLAARHLGWERYGELARSMGLVFEARWLDGKTPVDDSTLERPDFSATVDLYGIVTNSCDMRLMLFDYATIVTVAISALLPFAPLWIAAVPFDQLMDKLVGMLV